MNKKFCLRVIFILRSWLKIKTVKSRTRKYANAAGSVHFSPKHCLITLKKRILRSQMWPVELMHSKYRHKGRKQVSTYLSLIIITTIDKDVSLPKKNVPNLDPDSDYIIYRLVV